MRAWTNSRRIRERPRKSVGVKELRDAIRTYLNLKASQASQASTGRRIGWHHPWVDLSFLQLATQAENSMIIPGSNESGSRVMSRYNTKTGGTEDDGI
ncbi:unnamed protein product [Zymoseptoria tritici ST99CH_3D1]|nr:unnamed protein product [Zymoseptoria tritici ST99CH_3D1]